MMLGRRSFPFSGPADFQGVMLNFQEVVPFLRDLQVVFNVFQQVSPHLIVWEAKRLLIRTNVMVGTCSDSICHRCSEWNWNLGAENTRRPRLNTTPAVLQVSFLPTKITLQHSRRNHHCSVPFKNQHQINVLPACKKQSSNFPLNPWIFSARCVLSQSSLDVNLAHGWICLGPYYC